ncbi:N-acetyltransferase ESCO2 [Belonocnema kinseyi]|uniref:N-acetyltransferase ESCO2 n=1 Tax=Belonocnema kinseyi TaxID=2817044 RepID=UPI00143CF867|nr:N-acetyltransferase ESCO2 [Belonocnema kinseyi]
MTTCDSGQGSDELLCTPRRAKRIFGTGGSSTKRSLFQQADLQNQMDTNSGDESDLGPMSPLALTDRSPSSIYSSPGRQFLSPLASPEGSPQIPLMNLTWDRLKPSGSAEKRLSPFSTLRHVTKTARSSPRRKIFPDSPKSSTRSPKSSTRSPATALSENLADTPIRTISRYSQELILETPLRDSMTDLQNENTIAETPQKEESPEVKQITPLGSVNKDASLPRLHRRKTLGAFDVDEISPGKKGNSLKRHINDPIVVLTKLQKTEESSTIPKARAALFQDKSENNKNVTLDTKSFYGSGKQQRLSAFGVDWKQIEQSKKRRSLPAHNAKSTVRQSQKRHKKGEINCGVSHGLKKPKPKKHVSRVEAFRKEKQASPPALTAILEIPVESESQKSEESSKISETRKKARSPSPEIDPTKRFFKRIRAKPATVTVSDKIKLNVSEGKFSLEPKKVRKSQNKKPKLDFSLDATDLIIDEPEFESTKDRDVAKLIKVLEDDWTDDEYEPMDTLQNRDKKIANVEQVYPSFQDVMMSPASELSNMTSVMNIEDSAALQEDKIPSETGEETQTECSFYPLFEKGYSSNRVASPKHRGVKRSANWQISSKAGGADDQYQIDCGQKNFGANQCNECGIVYQVGDAEDENAHLNYHNNVRTLKFQGWKNEKLVWDEEHTSSRIILIEPSDPKQHWKKVGEILNVVDTDLGLADMQLAYYGDKNVYLYVRDKNVLGVLVAEPVKAAHRMIPELVELDCCSSESTPVKCGVNVVWTAMSHRRQGIARQLVDTIRRSYYFGYIMTMDDIAFSTPTPSGKIFAEKYTKTRNFKVYN